MGMQFAIYNPLSNNGRGKEQAEKLCELSDNVQLIDITEIKSYKELFDGVKEEDKIVICGGDGTLNRFINDTREIEYKASIFYYPTGSGNDFAKDIGMKEGGEPECIDKYIKNLPRVLVNGEARLFINGVGYGVDGYCCEVGDKLREKSNKPINYTSIAIKGLLFYYKRTNATVTIDGVIKKYRNVWIAPTMNGRYYGGGMMPTPNQDRLSESRELSLMLMHGSGKLKTLVVFPSIFKGEHIKKPKMVEVLTGKDITVRFDRPTALQIDGETVLNVIEYRAVKN